jgi:hypothetical protein
MKTIFGLLVILLIVSSCGKYEKPFITFTSPEKRLMDKVWVCNKVVNIDGEEFQIVDKIKFEIVGNDSIFTRISNYEAWNVYNTAGTMDTLIGTWSWNYALKGKVDKQRIRINHYGAVPTRVLHVKTLTKDDLVFDDVSFDFSTYSYSPN